MENETGVHIAKGFALNAVCVLEIRNDFVSTAVLVCPANEKSLS